MLVSVLVAQVKCWMQGGGVPEYIIVAIPQITPESEKVTALNASV